MCSYFKGTWINNLYMHVQNVEDMYKLEPRDEPVGVRKRLRLAVTRV